jgi:translation initiation factor IF-2
VYEVAKDVGLSNKDLVDKIRALGIEVKNHMSALEPDDVTRVKRALDKERHENTVVERIQPTVIRRRSKGGEGHVEPARSTTPVRTEATSASRRHVAIEDILPHRGPKPQPPVEEEPEVEETVEVAPPPAPKAAAKQAAKPAPEERVVEEEHAPPPAVSKRERRAPVVEREPEAPAPRVEVAPPPPAPEPVVEEQPEPPVPAQVAPAPAPEVVETPRAPERRQAPTPVQAPVNEEEHRPSAAAAPPPSFEKAQDRPTADKPRPKTQFELELERARAESVAKQAALAAQKAVEAPPAAVPGRPPVGSIIELPLPRIHITERGPGGRPIGQQPGGRNLPPQQVIPGAGQVRGRFAESQRPGAGRKTDMKPGFGRKQVLPPGKKARSTQITTPAEHKRVIKMEEMVGIADIAHQMGVKATEVLKKLWSMGMVGVNINQAIDLDTASLLANEFGFEVQSVAFSETSMLAESTDSPEDLEPRPPVVTVMGHVDHGKTSLLDVIRHADVAAGEAGGITQHIGAYRVSVPEIGDVVFLDTPGHAAFTQMRARGAQATDIVVLVCAADDGVMPQTIEALNHAKDAKVPIVVAATKIDKPQANPDRVKQQLSEQGLIPEEWGGETMYVNVSAYTKVGIDKLLEALQLQAQILELKANPKKLAKGIIVEAKLDRNRGPMATVLVQEGTLRVGDLVVAGEHIGKVRAMLNDKGSAVMEAGPSTPVEVLGLDGVPEAGDVLNAVSDEKAAKNVIEHRRDSRRKKEMASGGVKLSLENVLEKIQEGQVKELKIVLKTDVQGSAEALRDALGRLSTEAVRVNVIQTGVGGITESDVNLAKAGGAIIVGFHVRAAGKAGPLAEQEGVDIRLYDIIYDAIDDVKKAMVGLLAPIRKEKAVGKAEVRQTFNIPKIGTVAGTFVTEGKLTRQAQIRVIRDAVLVHTGRLASLKRFKDDVREVVAGYECGLSVENFNDLSEGDVLEAYEIVEEAATL